MRLYIPSSLALVRSAIAVASILGIGFALARPARAYEQYSQSGNATNCAVCHGDFRDNNYISNTDGMNWGDLHDLHRNTMLSGDCETCHGSGGRLPVRLNQSAGGTGLPAISCVGCHGRAEDNVPENPDVADGRSGYGAGLRQHHFVAGVGICFDCHLDADPANYTTVGENVNPPYYGNGGTSHPNIPTDACNLDGNEDFAGISEGLDNDGDNVYDGDDTDCGSSGAGELVATEGATLMSVPNPFFDTTSIRFSLPDEASAELRVLDANGRLVRRLGTVRGVGRVNWDSRDDRGRPVPSGAYWAELDFRGQRSPHLIILVR